MPRVIIVTGEDKNGAGPGRFYRQSESCQKFCLDVLRMRRDAVQWIVSRGMTEAWCAKLFHEALFGGDTAQAVLVYYSGHGGTFGWNLGAGKTFYYPFLAMWAKQYPSPILFLNDCCHSFSMVDVFEIAKVQTDKVGIIAACGSDQISYNGFLLPAVLDSWRRRKLFKNRRFFHINESRAENLSFVRFLRELELFSVSKLFFNGLLKHPIRMFRLFWTALVRSPQIFDRFDSKRWGAEFDHYFYAPFP